MTLAMAAEVQMKMMDTSRSNERSNSIEEPVSLESSRVRS